MPQIQDRPLRGRQREARRNDDRVLQAAREVFAEQGHGAPMSAVARRAGVGVASLYSRYQSKEELIRQLSMAGMQNLTDQARAALGEPDAWQGFTRFMQNCSDAGAGGLMQLAGSFAATDEHLAAVARLHDALQALLRHAKASGGLRLDITPADIYLLLANLRLKHPTKPDRTPQLRRRYLALLLAGMRATDDAPLPGRPPAWHDLQQLWASTADPGGRAAISPRWSAPRL